MRFLIILIQLLLCLVTKPIIGQNLESRVSINYQNVRLATVLAGIKTKYGVRFSYANNLIPLDKKVTISVQDKALGQALNELFKPIGINYTLLGGQIVLKKGTEKAKKPKPVVKELKPYKPDSGKSEKSGENSSGASDQESDQNAMASLLPIPTLAEEKEDGAPKNPEEIKKDFQSESRNLEKNYMAQMDVALDNKDSLMASDLKKDFKSLRKNLKREFTDLYVKAKGIQWNSVFKTNPKDSSQKIIHASPYQVSFFPPLSTNGSDNKFITNTFSFNILAGLSGGLDGFELGSIANIENGNVKGLQISGIANVVKSDVRGVQIAGNVNVNGGHLEGVQVAGTLNVSGSDSSHAYQIGGFANIHKGDLSGGQVGGFMNVNGGYFIGPQVAGFLNVAKGPVSGTQISGFLNVNSGNLNGAQVAGFLNVSSKNMKGTQVAGFMNLAGKDIHGVQVAGFLNVARHVAGSQVGLINIADSVSGVQFGLFSFARNGYRRLEVFGAERVQANLAFKMGSRKFHNIFAAGINPTEKSPRWSYGYGFGSEFDLGKKVVMNLDLVSNSIQENISKWNDDLNLLNQLKVNFGFHPGKRTTIFAGPTFNVAVSRVKNAETGIIGSAFIPKNTFMNELYGSTRVAMWAGFNAGIRF